MWWFYLVVHLLMLAIVAWRAWRTRERSQFAFLGVVFILVASFTMKAAVAFAFPGDKTAAMIATNLDTVGSDLSSFLVVLTATSLLGWKAWPVGIATIVSMLGHAYHCTEQGGALAFCMKFFDITFSVLSTLALGGGLAFAYRGEKPLQALAWVAAVTWALGEFPFYLDEGMVWKQMGDVALIVGFAAVSVLVAYAEKPSKPMLPPWTKWRGRRRRVQVISSTPLGA